jgi:hypothetical protein
MILFLSFNPKLIFMKKFLLLLFILFAIVTGNNAQTVNRKKMVKDVTTDLQTWLKKIPGGNESKYGFSNREEFSIAMLGKPYQMFTLGGDFFKEQILPGKNYLESTGEWRIPVMVNGENRIMMTVVKKKNKWKIVELGARVLAGELQEFDRNLQLRSQDAPRILRVFQVQSDFLFLDDPSLSPGKITVYPMHSALLNISKLREGSLTKIGLDEMLPYIKESIR